LYKYRLWRKDDDDPNTVYLRTQVCRLRSFVRLCDFINAVESDLHDEILLRTLNIDEAARLEAGAIEGRAVITPP